MKTKKIVIVIFSTLMLCNTVHSQVRTPNGTNVEHQIFSAGNVATLESHAASWLAARGWTNEVIKTAPATGAYNCHSYAWYMSEGGSGTYWVNAYLNSQMVVFDPYVNPTILPSTPNNIRKYWDDGSYVEVSESDATKVWYGASSTADWIWNPSSGWENGRDHSAVRITSGPNAGKYESKWGGWPRYIHAANRSPYNISARKYYVKAPTISGIDVIGASCSGTYTISGLPSGATGGTWQVVGGSGSNSGLTYSSTSGTSFTVTRSSGVSDPQYATIRFSYTYNGQTYNVNKKVAARIKPFLSEVYHQGSPVSLLMAGTPYSFRADVMEGHPFVLNWEWEIVINGTIERHYNQQTQMPTTFPASGTYPVRMRIRDGCGWSEWVSTSVSVH